MKTAWAGLIIAVAASLLSVGYNWRRVDEVATRQSSEESTYVRKDVISAQLTDIQRQMDEIKQLIARRTSTINSTSSDTETRRFDK